MTANQKHPLQLRSLQNLPHLSIQGERMNRGKRGYSKSGQPLACNQPQESEYREDGRQPHMLTESQKG